MPIKRPDKPGDKLLEEVSPPRGPVTKPQDVTGDASSTRASSYMGTVGTSSPQATPVLTPGQTVLLGSPGVAPLAIPEIHPFVQTGHTVVARIERELLWRLGNATNLREQFDALTHLHALLADYVQYKHDLIKRIRMTLEFHNPPELPPEVVDTRDRFVKLVGSLERVKQAMGIRTSYPSMAHEEEEVYARLVREIIEPTPSVMYVEEETHGRLYLPRTNDLLVIDPQDRKKPIYFTSEWHNNFNHKLVITDPLTGRVLLIEDLPTQEGLKQALEWAFGSEIDPRTLKSTLLKRRQTDLTVGLAPLRDIGGLNETADFLIKAKALGLEVEFDVTETISPLAHMWVPEEGRFVELNEKPSFASRPMRAPPRGPENLIPGLPTTRGNRTLNDYNDWGKPYRRTYSLLGHVQEIAALHPERPIHVADVCAGFAVALRELKKEALGLGVKIRTSAVDLFDWKTVAPGELHAWDATIPEDILDSRFAPNEFIQGDFNHVRSAQTADIVLCIWGIPYQHDMLGSIAHLYNNWAGEGSFLIIGQDDVSPLIADVPGYDWKEQDVFKFFCDQLNRTGIEAHYKPYGMVIKKPDNRRLEVVDIPLGWRLKPYPRVVALGVQDSQTPLFKLIDPGGVVGSQVSKEVLWNGVTDIPFEFLFFGLPEEIRQYIEPFQIPLALAGMIGFQMVFRRGPIIPLLRGMANLFVPMIATSFGVDALAKKADLAALEAGQLGHGLTLSVGSTLISQIAIPFMIKIPVLGPIIGGGLFIAGGACGLKMLGDAGETLDAMIEGQGKTIRERFVNYQIDKLIPQKSQKKKLISDCEKEIDTLLREAFNQSKKSDGSVDQAKFTFLVEKILWSLRNTPDMNPHLLFYVAEFSQDPLLTLFEKSFEFQGDLKTFTRRVKVVDFRALESLMALLKEPRSPVC